MGVTRARGHGSRTRRLPRPHRRPCGPAGLLIARCRAAAGTAAGPGAVYVRDSKAAGDGPVLRVGRDEWAAFVARVR
ncbi:DUF397 domain-containing protein [Streptomyces sp. TRM 70361]|uniref:DUF397 domain-containing protein n=1 Tax=Streptomyces sp. TRM 70361 TaxID=3116553 RepID=UPI003FCC6E87